MARRKKHDEEHVNHERWLITYSDLITLLLVFFIILFSMSTINKVKYQQLVETLSNAMSSTKIVMNSGNTGLIAQSNRMNQSSSNNNQSQLAKSVTSKSAIQDQKNLDKLYQEVKQYIQQNNLQNKMTVTNEIRGVQITMKDVALFNTGSAELKPDSIPVLKGLVPLLKQVDNQIDVEGYTDNQPIHTSQYASNWELSAIRAINVVHYLVQQEIAGSRLAGIGYGAHDFVAPNDTAVNRQKNRRVNIVILRKINDFTLNGGVSLNSTTKVSNGTMRTLGNMNNATSVLP